MKAIRHAGIVVSNLERSLAFYKDLLGLKIVRRAEEPGEFIDKICGLTNARLTTVKLSADDGNLVELLVYHSHDGKKVARTIDDAGPSHIAFTVNSLEKEYKRLKEKGVEFVSPPVASPDGYAKVAFCKDPDGVFIELVEELTTKKAG